MIIRVDFRNKELRHIVRDVEEQLAIFGFDCAEDTIPNDALACALDEVRRFPNAQARLTTLQRLEDYFLKRLSDRKKDPTGSESR